MCGLVAILSRGTNISEPVLTAMRDRLIHRGPDAGANAIIRTERGGSVALGHRRLSILDPRDVANQPMVSQDGQKWLVYNGEIYNFWELRRELEHCGRHFKTSSDSEVLLQAYEQWGENCVRRFNGMFAFFIWDGDRRRAFVARDRFGEKPLYFSRTGNGLIAFASEIKALTAHPDVTCAPDIEQVDRVMNNMIIHGRPETLFQDIERFMPAHCMWLDEAGEVLDYRRYWTPDYEDIDHELSEDQATDRFRELLEQSIARHTRSDVEGTACLSGGLDSSTLVGFLARANGEGQVFRLNETISARFPGDPTIDEGPYIDAVLKHSGVLGHSTTPTEDELLNDIRALHWHHEENILSTSMYLEWAVMRSAHAQGYKVIIDGQGADELLGGYQYYFQYFQHDSMLRGQWLKLWQNWLLQKIRLRMTAFRYVDHERRFSTALGIPFWELLKVRGSLLVDTKKYGDAAGLPSAKPGNCFRYTLASGMLYDSLPTQLHSGDRNSMAHSVESRFPFLDYELVDWCIRLPDDQLVNKGWQKYILRNATSTIIPDHVRYRPEKVGYLGPQDRWARGPLGEWMYDQISNQSLLDIPSYDREALQQRAQCHRRGEGDHSTILWQWASMAEWLSMFKEGSWRDGIN